MSEVFKKIQAVIKVAMFKGDTLTRDCLRTVVSDIKNQTVNANPPREITDDACVKAIEKSAKSHRDSISQFRSAGRTSLAEKEEAELEILGKFLPKALTEDETRALVDEYLATSGIEPVKKNMGTVMKGLPNVPGLDRRLVASILGRILK